MATGVEDTRIDDKVEDIEGSAANDDAELEGSTMTEDGTTLELVGVSLAMEGMTKLIVGTTISLEEETT